MNHAHRQRVTAFLLLLVLGGTAMFWFSGCGKKYKVDYCGQQSQYRGARDEYRAGAKVTLYYDLIATDTDYSFTLDGEPLNPGYDERRGYVIQFTMPDHDVTLQCISRNSMMAIESEDVMLVDYYDAITGTENNNRYTEMVLNRTPEGDVRLDVYKGVNGVEESHAAYRADEAAVDACYELIRKYKLSKWNDMEGNCIDGAVTVVKFRNSDGTYTRTSTDNYPDYGEQAYADISAVLRSYISEDRR